MYRPRAASPVEKSPKCSRLGAVTVTDLSGSLRISISVSL
jgi:hypothetical protein